MIGEQQKTKRSDLAALLWCIRALVPLLFIFTAVCVHSESEQDVDGDGVVDAVDIDLDNDGLLNSAEGYYIVSDFLQLAAHHYRTVEPDGEVVRNQGQGSSYTYPLTEVENSHPVGFHGTVLSTSTTINWARHGNVPKLQHESAGSTYVRWVLAEAENNEKGPINLDLHLSDLDSNRSESVEVNKQAIIGYSIDRPSAIIVVDNDNGKLLFKAATQESIDTSGSVTLHIRGQNELVLGYQSSENRNSLPGLNNDRAGFRHEFSSQKFGVYFPVAQYRDTDLDGTPDHLDLDSDNDGIHDVIEAAGIDTDQNGIADGIVGALGLPESAGAGLGIVDANNNGIADPYDVAPIADSDAASGGDDAAASTVSPASIAPDTDQDGLTDSQELYLGTDTGLADTDGDGFSDADEVIVFHTDPLLATSIPGQQSAQLRHLVDSDNDGITDIVETLFDQDGDGVPNQYDLDSDNDGIADIVEAGLADVDADGKVDADTQTLIQLAGQLADFDQDGLANVYDLDSDQDGFYDLTETGDTDDDANGVVDSLSDDNGDGWHDGFYGQRRILPDQDNDGAVDYLDADIMLLAAMQDDSPLPVTGSLLQTGLSGGAGCKINTDANDMGLSLLLFMASIGLLYRRRPDWGL